MGKKQRQRRAAARRLDTFTPYVTALRGHLCLSEWTLTIQEAEAEAEKEGRGIVGADPDGVCLADIRPMETRHLATLRLYPAFFTESPEKQRHVITHELLHIRFADLQFSAQAFEHAIDELSWRHLYRAFQIALERTIDDMAAQIAPSLPLPPSLGVVQR